MKKILMVSLAAALVVVAGGFFGFEFYVQHRAASEVEAAFERIRAAGGKASHGKVSFDLASRTLTIADIAAESAAQPAVSVKIASVTASGVNQPDRNRFSADAIEAAGIEVVGSMAAQAGWRLTYKAPRIEIKDYSGPAGSQRPQVLSSATDVYRLALELFAAVAASSITAPSLALTASVPGASGAQTIDYTYSNLALRDIRDGRIATVTVDRVSFAANFPQGGKSDRFSGEFENLAAYDFDSNAAVAILDPARANDDKYIRAYRQITAGAYTAALPMGMRMRMDGVTIDDVGLRPSKLQFPQLMSMIASAPPPGTTPTPAQARDVLEKAAGIYEGIRIGNAEIRGLAVETPEGPFKLAAIRLNLENGKIGEFAFEGLDARSPKGPVKVGRFALKSLDVANLLRMSSQFSDLGQRPSPDQFLGLLLLLEGAEIKSVVAPSKDNTRQVRIDTVSLNWGQFVGSIPSKARLIAKLTAPIDASDPAQKALVVAGLDIAAIDLDLGAAWTEAQAAFALDPVAIDIGGVARASAHLSLANVPRGVFSSDPQQAIAAAAQIEAGTLELTLRDSGGVDLAVAFYARAQNVSREAARQAIVESIKAGSEKIADANPDVTALVEALVRFVETPRQSLSIKLRPLGKVPALQLLQLLQTDPLAALAQFQIEASTGL
jgi:hypothetical protein